MGRASILSDSQLDEMAELRERGWAARRIVAHFRNRGVTVSVSTINWQCLRLGADLPQRLRGRQGQPKSAYIRSGHTVRPWSQDDDRQLLDMAQSGVRHSEISRRLRRCNSSVRGRLLILARMEARREEVQP